MGAVGQFIGVLLLIGFVGAYFWWIVALVAAVALIWGAQLAFREIRAEEVAEARRQAAVARRADQQHAWVLAGDERGVYGAHPPVLNYGFFSSNALSAYAIRTGSARLARRRVASSGVRRGLEVVVGGVSDAVVTDAQTAQWHRLVKRKTAYRALFEALRLSMIRSASIQSV